MTSFKSAVAAILITGLFVRELTGNSLRSEADDGNNQPPALPEEGNINEGNLERYYDDGVDYSRSGNDNILEKLQRRDWCARLGDYCVADMKLKFAECCKGLRCSCGMFPGSKCQCKLTSLLGR